MISMKRMIVGIGLLGIVFLVGMAGCASQKATKQPVRESSSVSAAPKAVPQTASKVVSSDSLEGCLAGIEKGASGGAKTVAEQSCQENEALRQGVVGTATEKSSGRVSSGTQGDSLDACMARIPKDATEGQRMLAEDSCRRDQAMRADR